jgi:hypothetical protein
MTIYEIILEAYPELVENQTPFIVGEIVLQNDSDGIGDYIRTWNYSKPLPDGLTLGKPTA